MKSPESVLTPRGGAKSAKPVSRSPTPSKSKSTDNDRYLLQTSLLLRDQDAALQQRLNDDAAIQHEYDKVAIAQALLHHERIREAAIKTRERVEREMREAETLRQEVEERKFQESMARLALERKNEQTETARLKAQQAEIDRGLAEEEARRKESEVTMRKKREEEAAAQRKESEAQRQKEEEEEAERIRAAAANKPPTSTPDGPQHTPKPQTSLQPAAATNKPSGVQPPQANPAKPSQSREPASAASTIQLDQENLHKRYIELHEKLKDLRKYIVAESKRIPALKSRLSDMRREIVKCIGTLAIDKSKNRKPMSDIQRVLQEALTHSEPTIDVSPFLLSQQQVAGPLHVSGIFVYLINILSKAVIGQFINEASINAKAADPVGVVAVTVFATPAFKINNTIPLIDILLAKLHVCCPILFGIYGNQRTASGRTRIGWWKDADGWVEEQRHIERMTGLGAGYAALSLRDFSKSKNENPFPNTHYWAAMARIINTPAAEIQPTHFTILKALLDGSVPRFVGFYGMAAIAVLRVALVEFPQRAPESQAQKQVLIMSEVMRRDLRLTL